MARADTVTQVNFVKSSILTVDERDQKVWELITDVPKVQKLYAFGILALNIILPGIFNNFLMTSSHLGVGTMLMSILLPKCSKTMFFVGLLQLLLAYVLIGYVISIYWGILVVKKALEDQADLQKFLDSANVRSDAPPANLGGAAFGGQPGQPQNFGGFPSGGNSSGFVGRR
jgi:hypothetical protein